MTSISKKKIVIFICTLELGGAERQAIILASELQKKQEYDVEVWAFTKEKGNAIEFITENNLNLKLLNYNFWEESLEQEIKSKLINDFISNNVDVIIPFTYWPNYFCNSVWKSTNVKICLWNQRDEGAGIKMSESENIALSNASLIISNSKGGKDYLIRTFNLKSDRFKIIHNGVYHKPVSEPKKVLRENLNLPQNKFIAIMVSNITRIKDHNTLVRAWEQVYGKSHDAILLLAGRVGDAYDEVDALIHELHMENQIKLLKFINNIDEYLYASDLAILSSKTEGLPNVVMEYMAAGVPVIATDLPGCRELLSENYKFYFKVGDVIGLSKLILRFHNSPLLRNWISYKNKRRVNELFSIKKMVDSYIFTIEDLVLKNNA
jgi:glycosyltransferase involved in cell wall biosynthesis